MNLLQAAAEADKYATAARQIAAEALEWKKQVGERLDRTPVGTKDCEWAVEVYQQARRARYNACCQLEKLEAEAKRAVAAYISDYMAENNLTFAETVV